MSVFDSVRIVVYRCHEKGLEVLTIKNKLHEDETIWSLPQTKNNSLDNLGSSIELENRVDATGAPIRVIAVEADWHQIPSVRAIVKHDVKRLTSKIKKVVGPSIEDLNYIQIKEALKTVMPNEYESLKELKDIIVAKNQLSAI